MGGCGWLAATTTVISTPAIAAGSPSARSFATAMSESRCRFYAWRVNMPLKAPHPCTAPGCSVLVRGLSRCDRHAYKRPDGTRPFNGAVRTSDRMGTTQQTYGSKRWIAARRTHLSHEPYCPCGALATTVDHDPPHDGTPKTFWDTTTWRSLCATCHNAKSGREASKRRGGTEHAAS